MLQQLGKNQQLDSSTDPAQNTFAEEHRSTGNFGAYRLLRLLGAGGMGEVWLAQRTDGLVEHQVAIKRVHGQTTRLTDRLLSERKLLARLSHPGIARFMDAGVDAANAPWLAMEYVDGVTITQWVSEQNLSLIARLELFRKVCAAVEHAHRHLIVHRDIKPNNVLVDRDGQPKLLDFGIAKLLDGGSGEFTVNAMTPAYAAPEQLRAEEVSTATSTGAAEKRRNETKLAKNAGLAARRTPAGVPYPFTALKGDLDAIVAQALRFAPEDRYGSVAEFSSDIGRYLNAQPVRARPASLWYQLSRFTKRNRLALAFAGVAFLALTSAAGVSIYQAEIAATSARRAELEASSSGRVSDFALAMFRELSATSRTGATPKTPPQILQNAINDARAQLAKDPAALAKVLNALGELQIELDSPSAAESAVFEALALNRQTHGEQNLETAKAMVSYAIIRQKLGDTQQAELMLNQALAIFAPLTVGQRPWVMAQSLLANICRITGRSVAALQHLDAARAIAKTAYGADHPNAISLETNRGFLLKALDRLPDAHAAFELAISAYQRTQGASFPRLVWPMMNLGSVQERQGQYTQALSTMRAAVTLGKRVLDANNLVSFSVNYANSLRSVGALSEAADVIDSIAIPDIHERPDLLSNYYLARAMLAHDQRQLQKAEVEFNLATAWAEKIAG